MAEIMSLATTVFMLVPLLAPALGELVLLFAPWRWVFVALLVYGVMIATWSYFRIPETLAPENRTPLRPGRVADAYLTVVRTPVALGYTLASACLFGGYFGFISSSEQVLVGTFHLGGLFALAFAAVSLATTAATLANARLVGRYGMRRISHAAVIAATAVNVAHALIAMVLGENVAVFLVFIGLSFFFSGLAMPNFSALALEPLGRIAGTASAAFGFATTTLSALVGGMIGRLYDGTATPVVLGLAASGGVAILIILITENGRLFRSAPEHHDQDRI
jgi:DHA1 family bicyclomycin/chloramphenicol resistance-like MFS transporter